MQKTSHMPKIALFILCAVDNHWQNKWILPVHVTSAYVFCCFDQGFIWIGTQQGKESDKAVLCRPFLALKDKQQHKVKARCKSETENTQFEETKKNCKGLMTDRCGSETFWSPKPEVSIWFEQHTDA